MPAGASSASRRALGGAAISLVFQSPGSPRIFISSIFTIMTTWAKLGLAPRSSRPILLLVARIAPEYDAVSRAFVKEDDVNLSAEEAFDRPQSPHPNYVTARGLAQLQARYHALQNEHGKLAAADDALARQQLAGVERDLRYIQRRLESAILVDPATQPRDEAHFGAVVEVVDEEGRTHHFSLVGEDEADAGSGRVSWISPLANALNGARVGDEVLWRRPAGDLVLEVVSIRYPIQ